MKKIVPLWVALILLSALQGVALASKDPMPPITDDSIVGTWEAVYDDDAVRVFRLEINKSGSSLLAQGVAHNVGLISKLEHKDVKSGKVELIFRNNLQPVTYRVNGKSYTTKGIEKIVGTGTSMVMDVQLIMEPDSPRPKVWKLRFFKSAKTSFTETLTELAKAAAKAAKRNDTSNSMRGK